jgi:hypothetical protein
MVFAEAVFTLRIARWTNRENASLELDDFFYFLRLHRCYYYNKEGKMLSVMANEEEDDQKRLILVVAFSARTDLWLVTKRNLIW